MRLRQKLTAVVPPTVNIVTTPNEGARGTKIDCAMSLEAGAGGVNACGVVEELGGETQGLLLTGNDPLRTCVEELTAGKFSCTLTLPILEQTRVSVLLGDLVYTTRPKLLDHTLPESAAEMIAEAEITLVSPMNAADWPFVETVIATAKKCVLQLSEQQLLDPITTSELASQAWLTVINDKELALWVGESYESEDFDVVEGIKRLRVLGVKNIIVTSVHDVIAFVEGNWIFEKAFEVKSIAGTIGAGDAFLGGLLWALLQNQTYREAIRTGLSTAALHVEGQKTKSLPLVEKLQQERARVPLRWSKPKRTPQTGVRWQLIAMLLVGVGIGLLL